MYLIVSSSWSERWTAWARIVLRVRSPHFS